MFRNLVSKALPALMLTILLLGSLATPAFAAEIIQGGSLPAGTSIQDDVFISAATVQVDGDVIGNLFASGEMVIINGSVSGDAIIAANQVLLGEDAKIGGNVIFLSATAKLGSQIGGSVFGASASLELLPSTTIASNLYYAGYSLQANTGSKISRDAYSAIYQAILNGSIARDAVIAGGAVEIGGAIGRDARLYLGEGEEGTAPQINQPGVPAAIAPGLRVDSGATIGGSLQYTANQPYTDQILAKPAGGIVYSTPTPTEESPSIGKPAQRNAANLGAKIVSWLWLTAQKLASLLLLGALAAWKVPQLLEAAAQQIRQKPLVMAGVGFTVVFGGYIAFFFAFIAIIFASLIIALLTLGGLGFTAFGLGTSALGFALSIFVFLVSYCSKLILAWLVGNWLLRTLFPQANQSNLLAIIVGVFLYVLPASIPFAGWLLSVLATWLGMGALWTLANNWYSQKGRATVIASEA